MKKAAPIFSCAILMAARRKEFLHGQLLEFPCSLLFRPAQPFPPFLLLFFCLCWPPDRFLLGRSPFVILIQNAVGICIKSPLRGGRLAENFSRSRSKTFAIPRRRLEIFHFAKFASLQRARQASGANSSRDLNGIILAAICVAAFIPFISVRTRPSRMHSAPESDSNHITWRLITFPPCKGGNNRLL
jgi:hypothetical protein